MKWAKKHSGFTIVELLIVVVVIAILAAITIVAYNGITNRAKESTVRNDVANAVKSLEVFKVTNSRYPTSQNEAKLAASGGNTPSYTAYDAGNGFCVAYNNGTTEYYATNVVQPKVGVCTPITNIATNPSLETNNTGWSARWFGSGGSGTNAAGSEGSLCGARGWRKTWTTAGGYQDIGFQYSVPTGIVPGADYAISVSARASFPTTHRAWISWYDSGGTQISSSNTGSYYEAPTPGEVEEITFNVTAPAGTVTGLIVWGPYPMLSGQPGFGTQIPVGATLDGDCVLLAPSSRPALFADGSSPNWTWSGAQNTSTSSGPAY